MGDSDDDDDVVDDSGDDDGDAFVCFDLQGDGHPIRRRHRGRQSAEWHLEQQGSVHHDPGSN